TVSDLYGQIDECIEIARRMGWKGIYASIDISWADWTSSSPSEREQLSLGVRQLLTTLSPLQRVGFGLKMSLPWHLFPIQEVRQRVGGRVMVTTYDWPVDALSRVTNGLIALAGDGAADGVALLPAEIWNALATDFESIWGGQGPGAAAALAR